MDITLGSLFDGAGGFPLAGAAAGFTPIWASEIEPFPLRVTTKRLPQMKHLGDITTMDGRNAEPVDVITFGSPCQDLSIAGRREGLTGERSGLFREAIRIIREMREQTNGQKPKYIVWENVPGAFSSNKGEDFRTVLEEIAKTKDKGATIPRPEKGKWMPAGEIVGDDYSIAWRTYDAQYWGVPQRRKRIYLVADFTGRRAGHIQFERESLFGNPAQGSGEGQGTAGTPPGDAGTPGKPVICLNDQGGSQMDVSEGITGTLRAELHGHPPIVADTWAIQGSMIDRKPENGPQGSGINKNVCFTLNTMDRHAVISPMAFHLTQDPIASDRVTPCISTGNSRSGQACIGAIVPKTTACGLSHSCAWKSANSHSRCYETEVLDTHGDYPTCAQGGNIINEEQSYPYRARRLTPLECCRLQGYPDWWAAELDESEPTEEEVDTWLEIFETHRRAVSPNTKPKTRNQVRKWLKHPQTDSAEYRMWGNSLAIPCAYTVLAGIAEALAESERTGS